MDLLDAVRVKEMAAAEAYLDELYEEQVEAPEDFFRTQELTPTEANMRRIEFFRRLFQEPTAFRLADGPGQRAILAYRIIKQLGRDLGLLDRGDHIAQILSKDYLGMPKHFPPRIQRYMPKEGIPTNPKHHPEAFCLICRFYAAKLCIPPSGRQYGLNSFAEPEMIALTWPPNTHIMAFEQQLAKECVEHLVHVGTLKGERILRSQYHFLEEEAADGLRLGERGAVQRTSDEVEVNKALAVLQLDTIYAKGMEASDMRVALQAVKTKAIVMGIARETIDPFADVEEAIREVIAEDDDEDVPGIEYEE